IEVESEIGKGTTFAVYLPACPPGTTVPVPGGADADFEAAAAGAGPGAPLPLASATADPAEPAAGPTILAVDDESTVLALARDVLEMHGYRVLTARNGEEALRVFQDQAATIDLVLLDLTMPVMGGQECFKRMKEINPRVRVLISSGFSAES